MDRYVLLWAKGREVKPEYRGGTNWLSRCGVNVRLMDSGRTRTTGVKEATAAVRSSKYLGLRDSTTVTA